MPNILIASDKESLQGYKGKIFELYVYVIKGDRKKIHISTDMLVSDQESMYIEFIGNVRATRENAVVTAHRLKIYYKWYCNYDKNCA